MGKGMDKFGVELRCHKKVDFDLFSHNQQEKLKSRSATNRKQNCGKNQNNNNTNDINGQSDKKQQRTEAKVQRKMIDSALAAGLAANNATSGQVEVSAVEAADITELVTDALNE